MDYRDFLQDETEEQRLPYFGGGTVCNSLRSWRIHDRTLSPGWYRFRARGRSLEAVAPIDSEIHHWVARGISGSLCGYHALGRFVGLNHQSVLYDLPRDEDLERFTPVIAWQWFDGNLLFGGTDFETDVEPAVREAFEDETSIVGIKAVTPALASAFLLESTHRELAREARGRREDLRILREQQVENEALEARFKAREGTLEGRIANALSHSGAELIDWRRSGDQQIVVRYRVGLQRIECVVDPETLRIVDSGICLEGTDRELNLSSLPSAVREAIDTGRLHVYRSA